MSLDPTKYIKLIDTDFFNGKVNADDLELEINSSDITVAISHIDTAYNECSIWFKHSLSVSETLILNVIVNNHKGINNIVLPTIVRITEESVGTGGNFSVNTISMTIPGNSVGTHILSWPYAISALALKFTTKESQKNDILTITVGEKTVIGSMTSDISLVPVTWTSQEYIIGEKVTYSDSVFGSRVYTCIKNTTGSEAPSNLVFWKHGFEIFVNQPVIDNTMIGYNIYITDDNVNLDDMGRVLSKTSKSIFVENPPTKTYLASSPTYIKQTVYNIRDYVLGGASLHNIGESKIGGSYIPPDTLIKVYYENNDSASVDFVGYSEYLF